MYLVMSGLVGMSGHMNITSTFSIEMCLLMHDIKLYGMHLLFFYDA